MPPYGTETNSVFDELIANEQRYAALFGLNPDPVYAFDREGRLVSGNAALELLTGFSVRELLGRPFLSILIPEDRERAWRHFTRAVQGEAQSYEVSGVGRDGREFTVLMSNIPMMVDGEIEGVYGIARDITRHKEAERSARDADERYRLLADNVQDMISLHDEAAAFLYASPSAYRLTGFHPVELIGRYVWDMVVPEDLPTLQNAYADILRREGRSPAAYRVRRADGRIAWFETTARFVMHEETGAPWRIIAVTRDITERRQLEQHLLHTQKMEALGRLAGGIAHDFNNMLTVIGGHAELLMARLGDSRDRDNAEHIRAAAHRAAALTRQLLRFGRGEPPELRLTDLNAIILDLQPMLTRLVGDDIAVDVALDPQLRTIRCEPSGLEQVVLNLAVNARDAMPLGGTLRIETENIRLGVGEQVGLAAGNYVLLSVSDTGEGMTLDVASHAFEPFFTTRAAGQGTGLGLSTVYSIVVQCGGAVAVDTSPGSGATFRLYFPGRDEPATLLSDGRHAPPTELRGEETILVAEDEPAVRALVTAALQRYGYRIVTAANGADALQSFHEQRVRVDAIVTDVNMPEMKGPEFVKRLEEQGEFVPVLYISGFTSESLDLDQLAGRCEFLAKPFTAVELAQSVRRLLDGIQT